MKLLLSTIEAKISGHQLGLAHLEAAKKTPANDNLIKLTKIMIQDLEEIKETLQIEERVRELQNSSLQADQSSETHNPMKKENDNH